MMLFSFPSPQLNGGYLELSFWAWSEHCLQPLNEKRMCGLPSSLDNFTIRTQADLRLVQEEAGETLTFMLFAIASVSLLVGGIGIMNVLLVSVTQRTREIGIRMAVGAKRRHILMQFLIEAITLSLMGGSLGVGFGIVTAQIATVVAGWPTIISGDAVMTALLFSLGVGLFFGLYPANKAARLNPIDALRYE
jgi:putative ABC transport system permease protein